MIGGRQPKRGPQTAEAKAIVTANLPKPKREYTKSQTYKMAPAEVVQQRTDELLARLAEGRGEWLQEADQGLLELWGRLKAQLDAIDQTGAEASYWHSQRTARGRRRKVPGFLADIDRLRQRFVVVSDLLLLNPSARLKLLGRPTNGSMMNSLADMIGFAKLDDDRQTHITVRYVDGEDWRNHRKAIVEDVTPEANPGPTDAAVDGATAVPGITEGQETVRPAPAPPAPVPDATPAEATQDDANLLRIVEGTPPATESEPPTREGGWPWS